MRYPLHALPAYARPDGTHTLLFEGLQEGGRRFIHLRAQKAQLGGEDSISPPGRRSV